MAVAFEYVRFLAGCRGPETSICAHPGCRRLATRYAQSPWSLADRRSGYSRQSPVAVRLADSLCFVRQLVGNGPNEGPPKGLVRLISREPRTRKDVHRSSTRCPGLSTPSGGVTTRFRSLPPIAPTRCGSTGLRPHAGDRVAVRRRHAPRRSRSHAPAPRNSVESGCVLSNSDGGCICCNSTGFH